MTKFKIFKHLKFKHSFQISNFKFQINYRLGFLVLLVVALLTFAIGLAVRGSLAKANSLVGFNEGYGANVHDSKGTATGAITSAVWKSQDECLVGSCLYFNGSSFVNFGNEPTYNFAAAANWTMELWFKTIPIASGTRVLAVKMAGADPGYKIYMSSDGKLNFYINDATHNDTATTTGRYDDNKWHYLSVTKSGTNNIYVYVDAILAGQNTALTATGTLSNSDNFYLGIDGNGSSNGWLGYIDEFKVIPATANSSDQIKVDYNKGVALSIGYPVSSLNQGLVGWWRMNETSGTLADSSGNSNTGTWAGTGASHYTAGKFGNGGGFNGTDDYVNLTNTINLNPPFTYSFWAKITDGTAAQSPIGSTTNCAAGQGDAQVYTGSGSWIMSTCGNGSSTISALLTNSQWMFVTAVYNSNSSRSLFVNGNLIGTTINTVTTTGIVSRIGARNNSSYFVGGSLDDVRIYNRALSPAEVRQLYDYAPGPVAYWNFDEGSGTTLNDISGNSKPLTLAGSSRVIGKIGNAINLATAGDYAWRDYNGNGTVQTDGTDNDPYFDQLKMMTVEAWIKTTTTAAGERIIVSKNNRDHGGTIAFELELNASTVYWNTRTTSTIGSNTSVGTIAPNTWYHITATYDGANQYLYVNGVRKDSEAQSGAINSVNYPVVVGAEFNDSGITSNFSGQIDDVKIYNYARTPKQITQDMLGGEPAVSPGAPVVYWKLDEGQGTSANDSSGNFNTGTITSGTWNMNGKIGKALNFAANTTVAATIVDPGASNSVSFWIYPTTSLVSKTLVTNLTTSAASKPVYGNCTGNTLALNTWTHIVAESDGSGICRIYQNGILTATGTTGVTYGTALTIGNSFTGTLDEFKFYNYPLSVDEVKVEYNGGAGMKVGASNSDSVYIAYDTFSTAGSKYTEKLGPGGQPLSALPWNGSTWIVSGGTVSNTPTFTGGDLVTNGNFSSDEPPGTAWTRGDYWTISGGTANVSTSGAVTALLAQTIYSPNNWYQATFTVTAISAGSVRATFPGGHESSYAYSPSTITGTGFSRSGWGQTLTMSAYNSAGLTASIDNVSSKQLTTSSLFRTVNTSTPNVTADANIIYTDGTDAGLILNLDSTTNPQNYILVYLGFSAGRYVYVYEVVNGVYTNKQATTVTYSAGADLKAIKNGTSLTVYYNGSIVGSTLTMTANTNTSFGLFSTYSGNTFDNFALQTQAQNYSYCVPGGTDYCANPVGEWSFDEGSGQYAYDSSGNGYTGTLGTGATPDASDPLWFTGKFGKALKFDGVDDYVSLPSTSMPGAWSLEFWVNPAKVTSGYIIGRYYNCGSDGSRNWDIALNNGIVRFYGTTDGYASHVFTLDSNTILSTNNWYQVVYYYDQTDLKIYINGKYDNKVTSAVFNSSVGMRIGEQMCGSGPYQGLVDQIRLFTYARTPAQIAWDYNKGLPVAWWRFDETSGTVANDASMNGATGTNTAVNYVLGRMNNAYSFNGATAYVSATVSKFINSISFWMQQNNTSNKSIIDLDGGTHTVTVASNAITPSVGWSSPTVYVDGVLKSSISDTNWHLVTITTATAFTASTVTIGKVSAAFFPGMLDEVKLFGYPLDSAQVKLLYNDNFAYEVRAPTAIAYLLNDQFTSARSAGSVNGTYAEPTGGVRTVTDTNGKLSILNGVLNFATPPNNTGDPRISYSATTRSAGKLMVLQYNPTTERMQFGFDENQSGSLSANAIYLGTGGSMYSLDNGTATPVVGSYSTGTNYSFATVLRSTGAYYLIKGGTFASWTLLWPSSLNSTATLYPGLAASNDTTSGTADNIRIPTSTWLPTPLAYDTFGSAGSTVTEKTGPDSQTTPQVNWTGGTKAGGVMSITPTIGSNVVVNGTFDTDSNWNKGAGWVISGGVATGTAATNNMTQTGDLTTNAWYQMNVDIQSGYFGFWKGTSASSWDINGAGSYLRTGRMAGTDVGVWPFNTGSIDNLSYKPLTLSTLFASVPVGTSNVVADVTIPAYTLGTQAGLVIGLDSASSPNNFLIAYLDGTGKATVDQNLGGTYTNIVTAATATWGATYVLRVIKDGTAVRLYYNNVLINTGTCSASITGTLAGVFSTYSGNTFDNFTVFPRGTGNEFNALNNY